MAVEIITYINVQVILNQRHKTLISKDIKAVGVIVGSPHCHKATTETSAEEKVVTRPEENRKSEVFFILSTKPPGKHLLQFCSVKP